MRRTARILIRLLFLGLLGLGLALVIPWPLRWLPVGLPAGGWENGSLRFLPGPTLTWPRLQLPLAGDSLELGRVSIRARGLPALRRWWAGEAPLSSTLGIERVRWGRLVLDELQGHLHLTGDTLRVDSLRALVGDQTVKGHWRARRGGSVPVWTLGLAARDMQVDTLWARLYPERTWGIAGRASLEAEVSQNSAGRVRHQVKVHSGPLALHGWPLALELQQRLPLGKLDPLTADSLRLELGGRNGSELRHASVWWSLGRVDAKGLLADPDLPGKGLDLNLVIELNGEGRRRVALPGRLDMALDWMEDPDGVLRHRARARGSLEEPRLELDTRTPRHQVEQRLRGLLRNLLGDEGR